METEADGCFGGLDDDGIFFKASVKAWVRALGSSSINPYDCLDGGFGFFVCFFEEIGLMLASDLRMGALISCLNFLACSLVLAPKVGGR